MEGWELPESESGSEGSLAGPITSVSMNPASSSAGARCPGPGLPAAVTPVPPAPTQSRPRSRSTSRCRSLASASSGSPLRHAATSRARVLMRAETAAPPPSMPGTEYWQNTLWNYSAEARSRLPRSLGRALRWVLPCAGTGAEMTVAQVPPARASQGGVRGFHRFTRLYGDNGRGKVRTSHFGPRRKTIDSCRLAVIIKDPFSLQMTIFLPACSSQPARYHYVLVVISTVVAVSVQYIGSRIGKFMPSGGVLATCVAIFYRKVFGEFGQRSQGSWFRGPCSIK
jgi:hypothetical protein